MLRFALLCSALLCSALLSVRAALLAQLRQSFARLLQKPGVVFKMVVLSLSISITGISERQLLVIDSNVDGAVEFTFRGIEPVYRSCVVPLLVELIGK